jgi:uncharacterized protein
MSFSLYAAIIPSYRQILGSVAELLVKAEAFCAEKGVAPSEIKSTAVHSLGAIEGVRRGVFSPDSTTPPDSFPALKARIAQTSTAIEAIDPAEVDAFVGRDMSFAFGDRRVDFTAENFLLSFSQPNFYFHAATAYDILRWKGVAIGKRDFLGRTRKK